MLFCSILKILCPMFPLRILCHLFTSIGFYPLCLTQHTPKCLMLYRHHLLSIARELLVMGGDSAKDQLRALAEGVRSVMAYVTVCATPSLPCTG